MDKLLAFYDEIVSISKVGESSIIFDEKLDVEKHINEGTRICK